MHRAVRLDRKKAFRFIPLHDPEADDRLGLLSPEERMASSHLIRPDGCILSGPQGILEAVALLLPILRPLIRLYRWLPGSSWLADRLYRWVADRRRMLGCRMN